MLTIIIIIALALAFYKGYRRGLLIQGIRLIGYIITFILSTQYYDTVAGWVEMLVPFPSMQADSFLALYQNELALNLDLDQAFYGVITFLAISFIGWMVTNFLATLFQPLQYYDIFHYANGIVGGLINLLVAYVVTFFILFTLSLIPIEFIQQAFVDNPLAYWIVSQTPFLSDFAGNLWFNFNPF